MELSNMLVDEEANIVEKETLSSSKSIETRSDNEENMISHLK